jgi:hypothetical protein
MATETRLVSRVMMNTLLGDKAFLASNPEFATISNTLKLASAPSRAGGCSGCRKRRVEHNAFNEFLGTMKRLPPERLAAIKNKVGAACLMYNSQNPRTGQYEIGRL